MDIRRGTFIMNTERNKNVDLGIHISFLRKERRQFVLHFGKYVTLRSAQPGKVSYKSVSETCILIPEFNRADYVKANSFLLYMKNCDI